MIYGLPCGALAQVSAFLVSIATIKDMANATKPSRSAVERRRGAIEATRGMFAHLAPGVSLADELIADRRAEVRAEEAADKAQQRRRGES